MTGSFTMTVTAAGLSGSLVVDAEIPGLSGIDLFGVSPGCAWSWARVVGRPGPAAPALGPRRGGSYIRDGISHAVACSR